jgi:molecular chaperone DnaK
MKKLIPRSTTIPVRRSDIFSTAENNQTMVEVHVLQGEREMAADNKSLGRFKLMGIPPAPRGVPQVLVSFDIDANGILQVTAVDKTTGREQGLTIQGASTLSEAEVRQAIQEAEKFAEQDRARRERVEKKTRAEALTFQAERLLREVALDFGMQFAGNHRRKIENLVQELRGCLARGDERGIDIAQSDLQDALYELNREVYQFNQEEEEEGSFFGSIKRTLFGNDEEDLPYWNDRDRRDLWDNSRERWDAQDSWGGRDTRDTWDSRDRRDTRDTLDSRDRRDTRDTWTNRDRRDTRDAWDRREERSNSSSQSRRPTYDRSPSRYDDDDDWGDDDEWL